MHGYFHDFDFDRSIRYDGEMMVNNETYEHYHWTLAKPEGFFFTNHRVKNRETRIAASVVEFEHVRMILIIGATNEQKKNRCRTFFESGLKIQPAPTPKSPTNE